MYARLAERLAQEGFTVLRFSFRGHGRSAATQRGVTIAGEMLDVAAAVERLATENAGPMSLVAVGRHLQRQAREPPGCLADAHPGRGRRHGAPHCPQLHDATPPSARYRADLLALTALTATWVTLADRAEAAKLGYTGPKLIPKAAGTLVESFRACSYPYF